MSIRHLFSILLPAVQGFDDLRKGLESLNQVGKDLGKRAFEFVVKGSGEQILLELAKHQGLAGEWLGEPGLGNSWFYSSDPAVHHHGQKSRKYRLDAYRNLKAEPGAMLARLGKVFEAADRKRSLAKTASDRLPDWMQYVMNDLLTSKGQACAEKSLEAESPWLSTDMLHRMLEEDGHDGTISLDLIFGRRQLEYGSNLPALLGLPDLTDYLLKHAASIPALVSALDAEGRVVLTGVLARPALVNTFSAILVRLASDSSKKVRQEAAKHLEKIEAGKRLALLGALLSEGKGSEREWAAELLGRIGGREGRRLLDAALVSAKGKSLQQAIQNALANQDSAQEAEELPDPPSFEPFPEVVLQSDALAILKTNLAELTEELRLDAEREKASNRAEGTKWSWRQNSYDSMRALSERQLRAALDVLNGEGEVKADSDLHKVLIHKDRLLDRSDFGFFQVLRLLKAFHHRGCRAFWNTREFSRWRSRWESLDLRQVAEGFRRAGESVEPVAWACLEEHWGWSSTPQEELPPDRVWPFFAEHPEFLEQGLGLAPSGSNHLSLALTLRVINGFPSIPPRLVSTLLTLALGEGKTHRVAAQAALARHPNIALRVMEALESGKGETRALAATWLAEMGCKEALPTLRKALAKESRETTRAILLTAMESLGEDLSPLLSPDRLLAEAAKGLKSAPPKGLEWFPFESLPVVRWNGGETVPPEVLRWWVVLAYKLKEPGGNPLLLRYLSLLEPGGREALGRFILRVFITQDTRCPSLEDAQAFARAEAPQRLANYRAWAKEPWGAEYGKYTEEMVLEQIKKERLGVYLGSAIGEKGILALAAYLPATEAVALIKAYTKDHFTRRSQIEAMLEAVASSDHPLIIQLLLSISRRYRTASVQTKARALVEEIAQRRGWSQDQLGDRTIPTAGFDERGILELDFGPRAFTVVLDGDLKPELRNPDGKALKALPDPNQADDAEKAKESKAAFSTCKKELKQVVDLQVSRLYEAMCAQRSWPVEDWKEFLHDHPIMGRLIQQLVWLDDQGRPFRPSEDGTLLDAQDEEVVLGGGEVRLAHATLVDGDLAKAWVKHLKDYKVKPLFAQMDRPVPAVAGLESERAIADRQGWVSDTFTLRGTFTKLGYTRGEAEDAGFFSVYKKDFSSLGIQVLMEFTGNILPEENVPAALKTLSFQKLLGRRQWQAKALPLKEIPPVLLAEAYADYHAVAKACRGYDPEWEKATPW